LCCKPWTATKSAWIKSVIVRDALWLTNSAELFRLFFTDRAKDVGHAFGRKATDRESEVSWNVHGVRRSD
jgi:hypothetical protein